MQIGRRVHRGVTAPLQLILIVSLSGFLGACATNGSFGRLQPSQEVSDMFVQGPLSLDYNYYYSGSQNRPRAIIGIAKEYTLETKRWKPVSADSGQIERMMETLTNDKGFAIVNFGSVILDHQGNRIGVWYSKESNITPVKMLGDNVVSVYPPTRQEARTRGFSK